MKTPPAVFFTAQSQRFGPSGVLPHHLERAERVHEALGRRGTGRVLELGAGAGGSAAATAVLGYDLTAIELSPLRAQFARDLAATVSNPPTIVEGDFYVADVGENFDLVVYWNGFGMDEDADQRKLLRRISKEWLAPGARFILDVYNPAWWARLPGEIKAHEEYQACQQTTFDAITGRFVDRWWPRGAEHEEIEQSIRCYTPADLILLLEGTGLSLESIDPEDGPAFAESYTYRAVMVRGPVP